MSEIVSVDNPFDELNMTEYDYMFDPYRRAAAAILRHMELYPGDIVGEQYDNAKQTLNKALSFMCRAPFNQQLGMYLNPLAGPDEQEENPTKMWTEMSAGVAIPKRGKPSYWARIQRQDGEPFGLTGISHKGRWGSIERWHALMTTIDFQRGKPVVELLGERPEGQPNVEDRKLLTRVGRKDRTAAKLQHCQTIYTVFDRTILSRQSQNQ